jgi:NitT/TauT family transport system substrate-binding protein
MPSVGLLYGPIYATRELGFFSEAGLDTELIDFKGGTKALAALAGGSAQFAVMGTASLAIAEARGIGVKLVASVMEQYEVNLVIQGDLLAKEGLNPASPLDAKLKFLKGRTLAVTSPGSATDQALRFLTNSVGLDPQRDLTITYLGGAPEVLAAFERKRIDGFVFSSPVAETAEQTAGGVILVQGGRDRIEALQDELFIAVGARAEWLDRNRDVARRFLGAYAKGLKALAEAPGKAGGAVYKTWFANTDRAVFDKAWGDSTTAYAHKATVDPDKLRRIIDFYNKISQRPVAFEPAMIDNNFAEAAEAP